MEKIEAGIYQHDVVIHEKNFVDPFENEIHTQNIENMWMRVKHKLKRQFGTSNGLFPSYLDEFVVRNVLTKNKRHQTYNIIIALISDQYIV